MKSGFAMLKMMPKIILCVAFGSILALGLATAMLLNLRSTSTARQVVSPPSSQAVSPTAEVPTLPPGNYPLLDFNTTLTQTVGGYTVTIGPLPQLGRSADANAVILPYRVTNSQGTTFTESAARLVDSNGQNAPQLVAEGGQALSWLGTTEESYDMPGATSIGFGYPVMVFDAISLPPGQEVQTLQLTLNLQVSDIYSPQPQQPGKLIPTPTGQAASADANGTAAGGSPPVVAAGPFVFRFQLPFDPLHSAAAVNQAVAANGVTLSLEQVIASSWEARIILSFASPDGGPVTSWEPTD